MRAKEIRELIKILEDSNVGELEITYWWGRKIRISKGISPAPLNIGTSPSTTGRIDIVTAAKPSGAPPFSSTADQAKPEEGATDLSPYLEIKSPMVGTFYRSPSPDSQPYVSEGVEISPGKVLCIIEAMKLMNEIEAEVSGKIVKILVENGRPVEYNQTLFLIAPRS